MMLLFNGRLDQKIDYLLECILIDSNFHRQVEDIVRDARLDPNNAEEYIKRLADLILTYQKLNHCKISMVKTPTPCHSINR